MSNNFDDDDLARLNEPFRKFEAISRQIEIATRVYKTVEAMGKINEVIARMTRGY